MVSLVLAFLKPKTDKQQGQSEISLMDAFGGKDRLMNIIDGVGCHVLDFRETGNGWVWGNKPLGTVSFYVNQ